MTNNFYSVDFLNINKSKKLYAWAHGLILGVFILNTCMAGIFMVAPPALACHGGITIIKNTNGVCSPDFEFTSTGPEAPGNFTLAGGNQWEDNWMQGGTYVFSEDNIPDDWAFGRIECIGGNTSIVGQSVTINLNHGDAVECIFYNEEVLTPTGSITVCKYEDENGDGDKDEEDGPIADWTVYADQEATTTKENGCVTFDNLALDTTYTISEDIPTPWTQTYPGGDNTHQVTLDAQNPIGVVSFLNHKNCAPPTGSITICKYYDNGVIGEYEAGMDTPLQWPFVVTNGTEVVAEVSTSEDMACVVVSDLLYGDYTVSELPIAGGYWINSLPGDLIYNVILNEECHNKTVTFLNYQDTPPGPGSITVCKYNDIDGLASTTDDRTLITDTAWEFTINDVSQSTVEGCTVFTGLEAGDYTITETAQTDWVAVDPASGELTVSLSAEEHKTVNFANHKDEVITTLIVKKIVVNGDAIPSDWTMHVGDITSFPGNSAGTATEVDAGMYQVTETGTPENYLLTYGEDCGSEGHVTIALGETKTCVLTNTWHEAPPQIGHLIVYKHVVGGEATSSDWTMHVGDSVEFPGTAEGEDRGYEPGVYIVSETDGPANYNLVFSGNCNATGSVEVLAGEVKECILTNTYEAPPEPYCGDGNLDPGEQCDDGNNVSGDGCSATCTTEGGGGGGGGGYIYLQILDLEAHCLTEDSAVINWRTNKTATSWVVYGIDSDDIADATSTEVTSAATKHSIIVDGLVPEVDYIFEAVSRQGSKEVKKTVTYNTNACVITEGEEGEPILTIVKSVEKEFVNPGDKDLEYTIVVTNVGNLTSFDTVLVDALPTGLTFADNGETTRTWELGDMVPDESKEITYLVNVSLDAAPMAYINMAKVSSSNHEEVSDIADVDIRTVEVLAITGFDLSELISLVMVITMLFGMGWFIRQGLKEEKN